MMLAAITHGAEKVPAVIAHRGASGAAPENTITAFQLAQHMGADWFELDCTLTRDGKVIVIHDDTLDRTTSTTAKVADLTLEQLKMLDAGAWFGSEFAGEQLPTLEESLALAKGKPSGVYVEIKSIGKDAALEAALLEQFGGKEKPLGEAEMKALAEAIEAANPPNLALARKVIGEIRASGARCVVQSFSPIICAVVLAEAPELRVELLGGNNHDKPQDWARFARWGALLPVDGMNPNIKGAAAAFIELQHAAGRTVAVWTVNEEAEMKRLAGMGVDAIITNYPELARKVVGAGE